MTAIEPTGTSLAGQRLCPKCARVNLPSAERCVHCHCHLLVYCKHCGEAVFRGESSCPACHEPLRHNPPAHSDEVVEQVRQQLARVQRRMRWAQAGLFLAAVLGAVLVLVKLANSDFDRLKPVPRDQMNAEEKEKDDINRQVFEGRKP